MAKPNIRKNYVYNLVYQLLLLIAPLITTPYVSRVLGADGLGTYSFSNSIAAYFTYVVVLGTHIYGQREISYVQNDIRKRSIVFFNVMILRAVNLVACLLAYGVVLYLHRDQFSIYLILGVTIISCAADVTWFFQGMEEFGIIVRRNIVIKILNIAFIFIFVRDKDDLIWYIAGIVFLTLAGYLSLWFRLPKYIEKVSFKELHPYKDILVMLSLFLPTIATEIYTVMDKTMIGLFTDTDFENGYYESSLRISRMILTIVTALGTVMIPRIGSYFAENNTEKVKDAMYRSYNFVWMMALPLCVGLFCVSDNIVPWYYGDGFDKVSVLLKISCFLIVAVGISNVTGKQYMIPVKKQNAYTITLFIGAGTNLLLNLLLIPKIFSVGAIIASVAAEMVIAVVQLLMVRKELSIKKIVGMSWHYLVAAGVMGVAVWFLQKLVPNKIWGTAILAVVGMIVYAGILVLFRDGFFLDNVKRTVNGIKKKLKRKAAE